MLALQKIGPVTVTVVLNVHVMEPQELFMKRKAIALLSGGLRLHSAVKMMLDLGIEVEPSTSPHPFVPVPGKTPAVI